jgi:hypothetical protein
MDILFLSCLQVYIWNEIICRIIVVLFFLKNVGYDSAYYLKRCLMLGYKNTYKYSIV